MRDTFTYAVSERSTDPDSALKPDSKTLGTGSLKGTARILKATLRTPGQFAFAMAQGAHNAPRMWGDRTVRPQPKVTSLGSGLAAGGKVRIDTLPFRMYDQYEYPDFLANFYCDWKELFLGTYDGIAGLVTQPYIGARNSGVLGAANGVVKGVAGTGAKLLAGKFLSLLLPSSSPLPTPQSPSPPPSLSNISSLDKN